MIVIGLDVHKQSVTAVAVDEAGRPLEEKPTRTPSARIDAMPVRSAKRCICRSMKASRAFATSDASTVTKMSSCGPLTAVPGSAQTCLFSF